MSWSRRASVLLVIGAMALVGCGAPAPSPSPTVRPSPTAVPGATLGANDGAAVAVNVRALAIELTPRTLAVRANVAFSIRFTNADPAEMPHVVDIRRKDGLTVVEEQKEIAGGQVVDYIYAALPPGEYVFMCRIHPIPSMTGTLRVR